MPLLQIARREIVRLKKLPQRTRSTLALWLGAAVVGLVAVLLAKAAEWAFLGFSALHARWLWWPFVSLPLGGMAIRWLMDRIGKGAEGSGIPQTMAAIEVAGKPEIAGKVLSLRIGAVKFVGIVMGLGSGFVLGREGPTVQIGASLMYACRKLMALPNEQVQRQLILAGGAAGIAAAFNTPLAGIVFAFEELARSVETETSGRLIGAVILAGVVALALQGDYTYFGRIHVPDFNYAILLPLIPVAVTAGLVGGLFSWLCVHQARWMPRPLAELRRQRPYLFIAACGLVIAACGLLVPVFGSGADETSHVIGGEGLMVWYYLPLKLLSLLATFITGLPGGVFAPALSLGAGVGSWFAPLFGADVQIKIVAIGMVAALAAVTRAPVTSAIIMIEMTDGHAMVISTLASAMIASNVARVFRVNLYHDLAARVLLQYGHGSTPHAPAATAKGTHTDDSNH
ncbi:chloride channel protein [Amantichitinum ursilacus]|uniref:H(+)/Cl(-) exchange transporter ClcA n=1 Tax=Amantichitinum ursilacus TaxID=857265 RepID=A0A0N0GMW6_9NEIS|nr:chloride channel protein [Amantichitinum ursilacus]KPC52119.1 H(+)/Cl(-) exchange transporter ClcA [Amantichitinum ursilacus]